MTVAEPKEGTMALERELLTYQEHLEELLAQEGKYVLIHGDKVEDVFDTYGHALGAGYERFKLEPFFVKQNQVIENMQPFSRDIETSCPA